MVSDVSALSAPSPLEPSAAPTDLIVPLVPSEDPSAVHDAAVSAASASVAAGIPSQLPDAVAVAAAPLEAPPAPNATAKKGRGAGKRLTDRERLAILEELDKGAGVSNADIARRYGITRAAVQKLKAKGAEVKARYRYGSVGLRDARKRGSHSVSVPFERELFEWVRGLKARKVPVPPSLVKEKAKLLVPKYNLGGFQASNGWYYNFCKRFSLTSGVLVEEKVEPLRPQQEQHQQQQFHQQLAINSSSINSTAPLLLQPAVGYPAAATSVAAPTDEVSKSDRILELLEKQAALIDRQTLVSEQQSETMKKLLEFLVAGQTDGPSPNV